MPLKLKSLRKTKEETVSIPKLGEIIKGTIVATDRGSVFLDLGNKGIGLIYGAEFQKARSIVKNMKIDEPLLTKVIGLENEDGYRELSVIDATQDLTWKELREKKENNETVEVIAKKANKGGLIAEIKGIPAFLPVSQLSAKNYPKVEDGNTTKIAQALQKFINQKFNVRIIDLDQKKTNIIISEKLKGPEKKAKPLDEYKIGDMVEGKISGVTNFGAFVTIKDNNEGLVYPSEFPKSGKKDALETLKKDQKVKAKIIKIADGRIYLSLKNLT